MSRETWVRLLRAITMFLRSTSGGKARWLLASLIVLMLCINGMNIANSFVGRYFMSAIETRDHGAFLRFAWLYAGVFVASAFTGVMFRFAEERLGLLWRDFLTRHITRQYVDRQLYLRMSGDDAISNPDQRMTEDVRQLTTTTLSFFLMILNGTVTVISFSGVLWTISPKLFLFAVIYALGGSSLALWLGRPLIRLNYQQADFEANFRSDLIDLRAKAKDYSEHGEVPEIRDRLMNRIDGLVGNFRAIISINRNLGFFTTGYNYFIQLVPVLVVAPMFISGKVEFGVIGQSAMAFATLLGAFSLVINQFQAISSYASVVTRLGEFVEVAGHYPVESGKPADHGPSK